LKSKAVQIYSIICKKYKNARFLMDFSVFKLPLFQNQAQSKLTFKRRMKEIFPLLKQKVIDNQCFALATVTATWGASPRPAGSVMAIFADKTIAGSVSGGCIEGEVMRLGLEVLQTGKPIQKTFGISDEDAWTVGLSCGGKVSIWIEKFIAFEDKNHWNQLSDALENDKSVVLMTHLVTGKHQIWFPETSNRILQASDKPLEQVIMQKYHSNQTGIATTSIGETVFIRVFPKKPRLFIVGAAHITVDLVRFAKDFDFKTIVMDPRGIFTKRTRFEIAPDELLEAWPAEVLADIVLDRHDYAVILSHDPKIDDQALELFLNSDIKYIGALGSSKTHQKRVARLTEMGFEATQIARIHSPIGLSIAARTAQEIALSIIAQLIQIKNVL
jgi:xanthine dehydrogenase accessory factor